MTMNPMEQKTNGAYLKEWWQGLPARRRKQWWAALGVSVALWLAGALHGPLAVAGLARLQGPARLLMALALGGFSFLWRILKAVGAFQETIREPNFLWIPLAFAMPAAIAGALYLLGQPPPPLFGLRKLLERMARGQGRIEAGEAARQLAIEQGVPLAQVAAQQHQTKRALVGLSYERAEGHAIVVAPTRAGKGLHLTEVLRHYPGPALVIDPKCEQLERTATLRSRLGPVYRIPGHQVHLSAYYRHLRDRDEVNELHYHLLRPWASREPIFLEKALSLFMAVGLFGQATRRNPLRLLLDLAESNPVEALTALRTVPAARRHVDIFTNGALPTAYQEDRFVTSALGNFTTRLAPYQKHIDTIAPSDVKRRDLILDPDWVARNATIYVTYSLNDLRAVSGVVAALIAALLRYHMGSGQKRRALVAIDELPAVGLRNIADYLSTCGGYGITLLLYVQSIAQLQELYGRDGTRAILSNCKHQVWYPAAEMETARFMSDLYGTTLKATPAQSSARGARQFRNREGAAARQTETNQSASWSWREEAAMGANEMVALAEDQVLVTTVSARRYTFLAQRLNPVHLFEDLPPPDGLRLPEAVYGPRRYIDWAQLAVDGALSVRAGRRETPAPEREAPPETTPAPETPQAAVPEGDSVADGEQDGADDLFPPDTARLMR